MHYGTEFSDPEMIENYRRDPIHNPYRLEPRGIRVFYCDPYCWKLAVTSGRDVMHLT